MNQRILKSRGTVNKRRLFILSFSIVCVVILSAGLLYWAYEQWAQKRLQFYIGKLEKRYTVEEHSLSDFHIDDLHKVTFYNDFSFEADCQDIDHIYFDRKTHALYFLYPIKGDTKAIVFHYDRLIDEI